MAVAICSGGTWWQPWCEPNDNKHIKSVNLIVISVKNCKPNDSNEHTIRRANEKHTKVSYVGICCTLVV